MIVHHPRPDTFEAPSRTLERVRELPIPQAPKHNREQPPGLPSPSSPQPQHAPPAPSRYPDRGGGY